jgi:hypothetical protein
LGAIFCIRESDGPPGSRISVLLFLARGTGPHVHIQHADGEAKFWVEPAVALAANYDLKPKQIASVERLIEEHIDEIRNAWAKHFPG